MSIFPFFKKKEFFSAAEKERIVEAIRKAEMQTCGEVRVYVERHNPLVDIMDRAREIFFQLQMNETDHRNAVLLYMATSHRELALFGDEGIFNATGAGYWNDAVKNMLSEFSADDVCGGVEHCIHRIGQTLKEKFPYQPTEDKNELPDEIIFGR